MSTKNRVLINSLMSAGYRPDRYDFKPGERVALLDVGSYDLMRSNPEWGFDGDNVAGTVANIFSPPHCFRVNWDNDTTNNYDVRNCFMVPLALIKEVTKKVTSKNIKLDTSKLDPLVIDSEIKIEIISVLKQHQNQAKIFDEWGLGETVEYGRGMTMLFWGGPGTGKTWGASCIAKSLGMDLLTIGASQIQTSEPGGANRNIENAFAAAKKGKVLFFDECDSLITVREEVGMILGSEINTLLTEIEKFEGVCILATNRIGSLDQALERRISLIVEFPEPNFEARRNIWLKLLPAKMPLDKDVSADKLAEQKLTGGQIKNVLLHAARAAAAEESKVVTNDHFTKAIKRVHKSRELMGKGTLVSRAKVQMDKVASS